jgi:hypothetical protein
VSELVNALDEYIGHHNTNLKRFGDLLGEIRVRSHISVVHVTEGSWTRWSSAAKSTTGQVRSSGDDVVSAIKRSSPTVGRHLLVRF